MTTPDKRGWGTVDAVRVAPIRRPDGVTIPMNVALLDLVGMLLDLTELAGYDLIPGQCWGYAKRKVADTNVWSTHAWGLAVDLNAPSNWRGGPGDIPHHVVDLWEDHGFVWGGTWAHTDPMHFEFGGNPSDAARITARLRAFLGGPGTAPTPRQEEDEIMRMIIDKRSNIVWLFGCGAPKSLGGLPETYSRLLAMGIPVHEDDGLVIDFLLQS